MALSKTLPKPDLPPGAPGKPMPVLFHTSHPGLAASFRRDPLWAQFRGFVMSNDRPHITVIGSRWLGPKC